MESVHLFYSWQSDRDSKLCRNFIEGALEAAKERIEAEHGIILEIDKDTKGVAGTPPITPTILRKIDACDIFVADMTFVGRAENDVAGTGKLMPNPNVMFEYGYARHVLDDEQILLAFNAAFGSFKELPFDLALMRRPTEYSAAPGISDAARRNARAVYADLLVDHLGQIVDVVLSRRLIATMDDETLLAQARARLSTLDASRQMGEAPVIVSTPCLKLALVPLAIPREHVFDNALMKSLRPGFVPAGFANNRRVDPASSRQWASHEPLRPIPEKPNDEARWLTRILRPGVFEMVLTIGYFEGDDPTTGVEFHRLEAEIVDAATRLARLSVEIGFSGPALVVASLHELETVVPYAGHRNGTFGRRRDLSLGELTVPALEDLDALALKTMLDGLWLVRRREMSRFLNSDDRGRLRRRRRHELRRFLIGFKLPRALIILDDPVTWSRHTRDGGDLSEATAQMASQDFEPVEIGLAHVRWSVKFTEARMGRGVLVAPQQFLEGHELSDARRHRVEQEE